MLDIIFGEQKTSYWGRDKSKADFAVFTSELCSALERYTAAGGSIFASGAYVASDLHMSPLCGNDVKKFCKNVLGISLRSDKATQNGEVKGVYSPVLSLKELPLLFFAQDINNKVYAVESPDALTPEKSAAAVMKYSQNNTNAAIVFDSGIYRTFVCGFPFETIVDEENRNLLMHKVLDFLDKK